MTAPEPLPVVTGDARSPCAPARPVRLLALDEHPLPSQLPSDLLTGFFVLALLVAFALLVRTYASTEPLMFLLAPIGLGTAIIVIAVVHDRLRGKS